MTVKKQDLEKRITYTLKKPHTHRGVEYTQADIDAGVEIEINQEQAKVLNDQGVIKLQED